MQLIKLVMAEAQEVIFLGRQPEISPWEAEGGQTKELFSWKACIQDLFKAGEIVSKLRDIATWAVRKDGKRDWKVLCQIISGGRTCPKTILVVPTKRGACSDGW